MMEQEHVINATSSVVHSPYKLACNCVLMCACILAGTYDGKLVWSFKIHHLHSRLMTNIINYNGWDRQRTVLGIVLPLNLKDRDCQSCYFITSHQQDDHKE